MPLDPRIPLGVQGPQVQSPFEALSQLAQLQGLREQTEGRRLAADEARTKHLRQQQIDDAYAAAVRRNPETGDLEVDYGALTAHLPGSLVPGVIKQLEADKASALDLQSKALAFETAKNKHIGEAAQTVVAANGDLGIWGVTLRQLRGTKVIDQATFDQLNGVQDPQQALALARSYVQRAGLAPKDEGFTLSPGQTRYGPGGAVVASAPARPTAEEGFTLSPGQTRFGPGGAVVAHVAPTPGADSGGGRPVTSGDAGRIAKWNTGREELAGLAETITETGATGLRAKVGAGVWNWVTEVTGWGTDAKKKQAMINLVKQLIGKTLEDGVLRKEDEIKYEKILPTIGDPNEVVISKLQG